MTDNETGDGSILDAYNANGVSGAGSVSIRTDVSNDAKMFIVDGTLGGGELDLPDDNVRIVFNADDGESHTEVAGYVDRQELINALQARNDTTE